MSMCQCDAPPSSRKWELPFLAVPERVPRLQRWISKPLGLWGMPDLADAAQMCAAELVTDVITHAGTGTPMWVTVSVAATHIRIEVRDPAPRRDLVQEEALGRRLAAALADRWGVISHDHGQTSWCELATGHPTEEALPEDPRLASAEAVLTLYGRGPASAGTGSPLGRAATEEAATDLIADLLHWFRAHGADPDTALDRAQTRFEARLGAGLVKPGH
ncbi:ATP-binding protein [Streptomyces roseifaciens]